MANLNVAVVSVDQKIWSGEAKSLIAKTTEGEIGILAGHEPVLSLLVDGVVRVEALDGTKIYFERCAPLFTTANHTPSYP